MIINQLTVHKNWKININKMLTKDNQRTYAWV